MKTAVHILATVRAAELLPAATLVFSTLRVGFPEADITVWGNALAGNSAEVLRRAAESVGAAFTNLSETAHDIWIEGLVNRMFEPFWIVDTDVVFFGPLPGGGNTGKLKGVMLAGRFEPEFMEEWTGTRHVERLHTAVMYIEPTGLRSAAREWMARIPLPWRKSAEFTWIRQAFVPRRNATGKGETLFYDTMAGVYHALGAIRPGQCRAFTEAEDEAFEHLHCGGYVDLVAKDTEFGKALQAFHQRVYENPAAARGARLKQAEYYALRSSPDGAMTRKRKGTK